MHNISSFLRVVLYKQKNMRIKNFCVSVFFLALCFVNFSAHAASGDFILPPLQQSFYPEQSIRLFIPGALAEQDAACLPLMGDLFKVNNKHMLEIVLEEGRGGALAINTLLMQEPDGYAATLVLFPDFYLHLDWENSLYMKEEVEPVFMFAEAPLALWVAVESPFKTLKDFIESTQFMLPGSVLIAGNGSATASEMTNRMLNRSAGVATRYSPFLSQEMANDALLARKCTATWGLALSPTSMPGMRPLAVAAHERVAALQETPTFKEAGTPLTNPLMVRYGFVLPKGVLEKRKMEFVDFMQGRLLSPQYVKLLDQTGFTPVALKGKELQEFLEKEEEKAFVLLQEFPFP